MQTTGPTAHGGVKEQTMILLEMIRFSNIQLYKQLGQDHRPVITQPFQLGLRVIVLE